MSQADYHAWLYKAATGWLGWSPAAALAATLPEIHLAYEGRIDLLGAIFGKPKPDDRPIRRWRKVEKGTLTAFLKAKAEGR